MSAARNTRDEATAFAPASVANVAVGFDILGHPIDGVGDTVTVRRTSGGITISKITGVVTSLPTDPEKNTATVGLLQMHRDLELSFGFDVSIEKGIPLSSGMGGSAASSVAAILAANELLDKPLDMMTMFRYALMGEQVATGAQHFDNAAASLFGGLVLALSRERMIWIPIPKDIRCVVVRPDIQLETRKSREVLGTPISIADHVAQTAHFGGFVVGCYENDIELIRQSLKDDLIEPRRAELIPGFAAVKKAALDAGALGCSIAGSGPSMFAWTNGMGDARKVGQDMVAAFKNAGQDSDVWISRIPPRGAHVVPCDT